jgi:hypothetical protein
MFGFGPPASRPARREWWRRPIQRQKDGNLPVAEFCRRLGVSTVTFYAWKRRFREVPVAFPLIFEKPAAQPAPTANGVPTAAFLPVGTGLVGKLDCLIATCELVGERSEPLGCVLDVAPEPDLPAGLTIGDRHGDGVLGYVQPNEGMCTNHDPSLPEGVGSRTDPVRPSSRVGTCRGTDTLGSGHTIWEFLGSDQGGQTAAVLMSLCTTCKNLGIDPQAYLRDVLDRISTHPARRIEELLPDRWQAFRQASAAAQD